jgi:putative toxin-antitoxin system antitoxin component (TIGR02293 family)
MSYKEENIKPSILSEPMSVYITQSSVNPFYGLLRGIRPANLSSDFSVVQLTRKGLPKKVLLSLIKDISLTIQELANVMHISERTFQRYDNDSVIKAEYAEKAIELARLYGRGEEVFGAMDKFKLWVRTPSIIFNGESPLSLLDTSAGFDMVFKELGRIEYGIFA